MINNLITHLQLFAIGFSFGVAGPCLFTCTPIVAAFVASEARPWKRIFSDIFIFLSGRFIAYLILGFAAGLSGIFFRQIKGPSVSSFFKPLAGVVTIFFAAMIFIDRQEGECLKPKGAVAVLGFSLGMAPCAPLLAVLFDIALMSASPIDGLSYAMSFGIGTFLSGMIVISVFTGLIKFIPQKILRSRISRFVFKLVCAALLAAFAIRLFIS